MIKQKLTIQQDVVKLDEAIAKQKVAHDTLLSWYHKVSNKEKILLSSKNSLAVKKEKLTELESEVEKL